MDGPGGSLSEIRNCERTEGELWPCRMGRKPNQEVALTVLGSIRRHCVDNCMCGQANEVRLCPQGPDGPGTTCPLYHFRLGHNPNRAGIGNKSADITSARKKLLSSGRETESLSVASIPSGNGQASDNRTQRPIPRRKAEEKPRLNQDHDGGNPDGSVDAGPT